MGNFEGKMPKELKRAHYHQWGLMKQDPDVKTPVSGQKLYGLLDTIKMLGHEKLDVIDIFKIDCEFDRDCFPLCTITIKSNFGLLCGIYDLISTSWNNFAFHFRRRMRMGNLHRLAS
jgi:hypothetical protein